MTPDEIQAFYDGAGIHAASLNLLLRLSVGLLMIVASIFIVTGLLKLLEDNQVTHQFRFIFYLMALAVLLMLFFSFVVA